MPLLLWGSQSLAHPTITLTDSDFEQPIDPAAVIQDAIDHVAGHGGGLVRLEAGDQTLILRRGLRITASGITLDGAGSMLRLADGASTGRAVHMIEVRGTPEAPIDDVIIRDLTLDANVWAQPDALAPHAIDIANATDPLVERVHIERAFIGLRFGAGLRGGIARGCVVSRWHDTAYAVSAEGVTGGARSVLFQNCIAENAPDERAGGDPGNRGDAWLIGDGARAVSLIDCVVRNAGGNGFGVRNRPGWPGEVVTGPVRFAGCVAEKVTGDAWMIAGATPSVRVEGITLSACSSDGTVSLRDDIRGLTLVGCRFGDRTDLGPVRDATVTNSTLHGVRVWSETVPGPGGYDTDVTFSRTNVTGDRSIIGNLGGVQGLDTEQPMEAP